MKAYLKKALFLMVTLLFTSFLFSQAFVAYASTGTMEVTVRIEGITKNIYYKTISVPYDTKLTVQQAIDYLDKAENSITIKGLETAYITDINGEAAGKFGGWDGWLFRVNNQEPVSGMDAVELKAGDSILVYYGDPYGVGMQYPEADFSNIKDGIIKFTSKDTTYDSSYKPTTSINPVEGAEVKWYNGTGFSVYTTDNKGEIKIDAALLTKGAHKVEISKTGKNGLPIVLRSSPDLFVTVQGTSNEPQTGDSYIYTIIPLVLIAVFSVFISVRKNRLYEN